MLEFVENGGASLESYPQYHKVVATDGVFEVPSKSIARYHRLNIGSITSDSSVEICFLSGKTVGYVDESFVSQLKKRDRFTFAGRALEFVALKDFKAHVRLTTKPGTLTPRWQGSRIPLSGSICDYLRMEMKRAREGEIDTPELKRLQPIFEAQRALSEIPLPEECLVEILSSREGKHVFVYPFEGRTVHQGLATLFAYRISQQIPVTLTTVCNDYGFELTTDVEFDFEKFLTPLLFSTDNLEVDVSAALNVSELARRQFREIARVSGLTLQNHGASRKTARQVQASSGLIFDVLSRYEPTNVLLRQARREVLERQLEHQRLSKALERLAHSRLKIHAITRPTPLSFPLLVDRLATRISSESLAERVEKMKKQWLRVP